MEASSIPPQGGHPLFAVPAGRRRRDRTARGALAGAVGIALLPLVAVLVMLIVKGIGVWSPSFFTSIPDFSAPDGGGIAPAIVGSLMMVGLATLLALPVGIGAALYLSEYGKDSRLATAVRYFTDVMTGVPSIVFGLFSYVVLVLAIGHFAAWAGSVAIALLMLPIIIRSVEVVLVLVPQELRESALALGSPRWKVVWKVVLPTALPGILTGVLLAIARASGETAPLLFTALFSQNVTTDMSQSMASMPVLIYNNTINNVGAAVNTAWGTALALVTMVLILTVIARLIGRRSRLGR